MSIIKIPRAESEQRVFQFFLIYLRFCGLGLIGMGFQRILIAFSIDQRLVSVTLTEFFVALWMGARFDLLVFGFFGIPFILLILFFGLSAFWPQKTDKWTLKYFSAVWILIGIISIFDFCFFQLNSKHMHWLDHQSLSYMNSLTSLFQRQSGTTFFLNLAVWILSWLMFLIYIQRLRLIPSVAKSPGVRYIQMLGAVLMIAFFARGTWEPHHLALEHSEISQNQILNELVLNPLWTFDKAYTRSNF